jgi:hypothetical protein
VQGIACSTNTRKLTLAVAAMLEFDGHGVV